MKPKRDDTSYERVQIRWLVKLQIFTMLVAGVALLAVITSDRDAAQRPIAPTRTSQFLNKSYPRPTVLPTNTPVPVSDIAYAFSKLTPLIREVQPYASRPFVTWSEHRDAHAYLEYYLGDAAPKLFLHAPSSAAARVFSLPRLRHPYQKPEFIWSRDGSGYVMPSLRFIWSPDGAYVLLEYFNAFAYDGYEADTWYYSVFGKDGLHIQDFFADKLNTAAFRRPRATWLGDSRTVMFVRGLSNTPSFYDITRRTTEPKPASVYPVFQQELGKTTILLANPDGNLTSLVENADSIGEPSWSSDGKWVAVVWSRHDGERQTTRLTWSRADGSARQTYHDATDNIRNLHDLQWIEYKIQPKLPLRLPQLAFVASRESGQRVEVLGTQTGTVEYAGDLFTRIERLRYRPVKHMFQYWWRDAKNRMGIASYSLLTRGGYSSSIPISMFGNEVFRDPYTWVKGEEIFPSWDGETYAIRFSNRPGYSGFSSAVIRADGQWSRIVHHRVMQVAPPCWTRDSKHLFLYYIGPTSPHWQLMYLEAATGGETGVPIGDLGMGSNRDNFPCFNNDR
jgi:hypothetical protein